MVAALDEAVGNITTALEERGFMKNALLIFTTDVSIQNLKYRKTFYVNTNSCTHITCYAVNMLDIRVLCCLTSGFFVEY